MIGKRALTNEEIYDIMRLSQKCFYENNSHNVVLEEYSKGKKGMRMIGVIASNFNIALDFVDILVGDFPIKELDRYERASGRRYEVHLKNGDIYKALRPSEYLRGLHFYRLYIHETVDKEFVECIAPFLTKDITFFRI